MFRYIAVAGLLLVLGVLAITAEVTARYREKHRETPPDYIPSAYYPHKRLRYALIPNLDYYGWFKINSLGFRGPEVSRQKPPGTVRIICLGGSTTFDIGGIGKNASWPEVLQQQLRRRLNTDVIQVLNLGIPGATSLDSLVDLQTRALTLQPDLVIVYQAHNDFIYSVPPARVIPSGLFPQEDSPRGNIERWLTVHSLLYAKSRGAVSRLIGPITSLAYLGDSVETSPRDRDRAIAEGLSTFRDNLRSIRAITRENGIALALPEVIVPFPTGSGEACRRCNGVSQAYAGLPISTIRSVFAQYNDVLKQLESPDQRSYFVPTDGFVPAADPYYLDAVHFGPRGSTRMGKALAAALEPVVQPILTSVVSRR